MNTTLAIVWIALFVLWAAVAAYFGSGTAYYRDLHRRQGVEREERCREGRP